ncbi:MAG: VPLPA-CTERM sorting domain-containing protein [Pseudomonadota bacterium]
MAGAILAGGASSASAVTLADFDGIQTGTLVGDELLVALIGSGACVGAAPGGGATGSALCGADVDDNTLTFSGIDFDQPALLSFSLAAFIVGSGDFDPPDTVSVTANGVDVITFNGIDGTAIFEQTSGAIGGGSGAVLNDLFQEFRIDTAALNAGIGDLVFFFDTSATTENVAVDSVTLSAIPLPAGGFLLLGGLGGLALMRRRQSQHG